MSNEGSTTDTTVSLEPACPAPAPGQEVEEVKSSLNLLDGDIVIKKQLAQAWDFMPCFGTVLKQIPSENANEKKKVTVQWEVNSGVEAMLPDDVGLVDRFMMRNTKVENKNGVVGTVTSWSVLTTVQLIGTNHVVDKVNLDRLRPITSFIRGQEVMYKDWIGVISTVKRNVWFLLDGGMGFHVPVTEKETSARTDPYWGVGMPCPGIRTKLRSSVLRSAKWTSGPMKFFTRILPPLSYLYSRAHVTLNKAEVIEIEVLWLRRAPLPDNPVAPKPPAKLNRDMLSSLSVIGIPSTETVGINSVRLLKLKPEDSLTNYQAWLDAFNKKYCHGNELAEPPQAPVSQTAPLRVLATDGSYEVPVKVLSRKTMVEVAWNDGSVERIHAVKIPKIRSRVEDHEFPKGMIVAPLYPVYDVKDYYGVVVDSEEWVSTKSRKVNILWILNGSPEKTQAETVFSLKPHPLYSLFERGTIVFPTAPAVTKFKSAVVSDLNIMLGKMVVIVTESHTQHEVYPHQVTPLPVRCFWNHFLNTWTIDEIVVPPYQLEVEFGPVNNYVDVPEPSPDVLTNNNQETGSVAKSAWDEPQFEMLAFAPTTHRYYKSAAAPKEGSSQSQLGKKFLDTMGNEQEFMKKPGSVSEGIWVRTYENRMDLISAFFVGPFETPYEDAVLMFDLQVDSKFPTSAPKVHFVSYSFEIGPYIAWDGNFCTSALEWETIKKEAEGGSVIATYLKHMQALIFSPEPLLTGPRDFVDVNNPKRKEFAKFYNEFVVVRVLDSIWNMIHRPCEPWTQMIKTHFNSVLPEKLAGYEDWDFSSTEKSEELDASTVSEETPETKPAPRATGPSFPLYPVSEGFKESFLERVQKLRKLCPNLVPQKSASKIADITADSESVPVEEKPTTEVLEDKKENANVDEAESSKAARDLDLNPRVEEDASVEKLLPKSPTEPKSTLNSLDSQKNIIQPKGKKDKKAKKGKKGKGMSSGSGSGSGSQSGSESATESSRASTASAEAEESFA